MNYTTLWEVDQIELTFGIVNKKGKRKKKIHAYVLLAFFFHSKKKRVKEFDNLIIYGMSLKRRSVRNKKKVFP